MASTAAPTLTLHLRIVCPRLSSPAGAPTEFGVQDRQHQIQPGEITADGLLAFAIAVPVVRHPGDGSVRYRGPLVHGTPAEPHLYLSLRRLGGEPTAWLRRIKVRFPVLTWDQVAEIPDTGILATYVSGERSRTVPLHTYEWTRQDTS